jgi:hypothetical protein
VLSLLPKPDFNFQRLFSHPKTLGNRPGIVSSNRDPFPFLLYCLQPVGGLWLTAPEMGWGAGHRRGACELPERVLRFRIIQFGFSTFVTKYWPISLDFAITDMEAGRDYTTIL